MDETKMASAENVYSGFEIIKGKFLETLSYGDSCTKIEEFDLPDFEKNMLVEFMKYLYSPDSRIPSDEELALDMNCKVERISEGYKSIKKYLDTRKYYFGTEPHQ